MPLKPAARVTDVHSCPAMTGDTPHVGGPNLAPCERTVEVNGLAHARATDKTQCNGPTDTIVTGAATVKVGGQPAARVGEKSAHGGEIRPGCSPDTYIGGPSTGVIVGNLKKGKQACEDLALDGDKENSLQSWGNCGLESIRQIINTVTNEDVGEKELIDVALERNVFAFPEISGDSSDPYNYGASSVIERAEILEKIYHIDTTIEKPAIDTILSAVAEGKGVVSTHNAGILNGSFGWEDHAVSVIAVEYDAKGNPKTVFINDTGRLGCGAPVPFKKFKDSLRTLDHGIYGVNITKDPVW